jgi:hypothetical protein
MRSIQHTITTLLLTASVVGGAALLSGTMTQLEQFRRDFAEIEHVIPTPVDQHPWAQSRSPRDMIRQG